MKGFGIKNSHKYVSRHKTVPQILRAMRLTGLIPIIPAPDYVQPQKRNSVLGSNISASVSSDGSSGARIGANNSGGSGSGSGGGSLLEYEFGFYKAFATFRHQTVFDPNRREVRLSSSILAYLHHFPCLIVFLFPFLLFSFLFLLLSS